MNSPRSRAHSPFTSKCGRTEFDAVMALFVPRADIPSFSGVLRVGHTPLTAISHFGTMRAARSASGFFYILREVTLLGMALGARSKQLRIRRQTVTIGEPVHE